MQNNDKSIEHLQIAVDIWKNADKDFSIVDDARIKLKEWTK